MLFDLSDYSFSPYSNLTSLRLPRLWPALLPETDNTFRKANHCERAPDINMSQTMFTRQS